MTACIVGWAHLPFGRHQDETLESMIVKAAAQAIEHAGIGPDDVDEIVTATSGRTLKLSYKGGTAEVDVPPDVPIVTPVAGDRTLLVPGKAVVAFMRQQTDGSLMAASLTVEKDGVKPA